jgi:hypothetical protein
MHPYTFPKGMDLIVALATPPDPDARFGSPTDLPHLNYDFRLSALNGHSLTAHNDSTVLVERSVTLAHPRRIRKREETPMRVMALALHFSELY